MPRTNRPRYPYHMQLLHVRLILGRLRRARGKLVLKKSSKLYADATRMLGEGRLQQVSEDTTSVTYTLPGSNLKM
jgi:hypothetical protein